MPERPEADAAGPLEQPYWWEEAPPIGRAGAGAAPARCDVAVIGAGITGLAAARRLALGGASVVVLDQGEIAAGASSRAFGLLGRQYHQPFRALLARHGREEARALFDCCNAAFAFVNGLIEAEAIDCDRQALGRVISCATERQLDELRRELELRAEHFGHRHVMLDRAALAREIGAGVYAGGALLSEHAAVHPGKLARGLAERVAALGARLEPRRPVVRLARQGSRWRLETPERGLEAGEVVVATNGYTGPATGWLMRRIVPIPAYMIATEPLAPEVMRAALPGGRPWHDAARDMVYARPSPDGRRLLFGAFTGEAEAGLAAMAGRLRARMLRLFPGLPRELRLSHVWTGRCGGTFDRFPHAGRAGGLHFAMGYGFGAGLPFGSWLGDLVARRLLGERVANPILAMAMPTRPLYRGRPWFMPAWLAWQKLKDRRDGLRVNA